MRTRLSYLLFILTILLISTSFGYISFLSPNFINTKKGEILFKSGKLERVVVRYSKVNFEALKGDPSKAKRLWFYRLKKLDDRSYKIILPKKSGIYFVDVVDEDEHERKIFFLSNLKGWMIEGKSTFFVVYDLKKKKFLDKIFTFSKDGKKIELNGPIFSFKPGCSGLLFHGNDVVYFRQPWDSLFFQSTYPKNRALIILDRPVYKPGQNVLGRIILLRRKWDRYVLASGEANVKIKDPYGNTVFSDSFKTSEEEAYHFEFKTTREISTGYYTVEVDFENEKSSREFMIKDYVKPSFEIFAETEPRFILSGKLITLKVKLKYLDGKPLSNGQISLYCHEYMDFYEKKMFYKDSKFTDENGEAVFNVVTSKDYIGYLTLQILANDESGIQVEKTIDLYVHRDEVIIDGEFLRMEGKDFIKLKITDPNGNPLSGKGKIWLGDLEREFELKDGKAIVDVADAWKVTVKFKNEYRVFYRYFHPREEEGEWVSLKVIKEGDLHPGSEFTVVLSSDSPGILVVGGEKMDEIILVDRTVKKTLKIREDEFSDRYFMIFKSVDGRTRRWVYPIVHEERVGKLEITTDKKEYQPGETIHFSLRNVGEDESKVISVVDKGVYLIREDRFSISNYLYPTMKYPNFQITSSLNHLNLYELFSFEKKIKSHVFTSSKEGGKGYVRQYFPDTAFWVYDAKGNEFSFKAPDTITTWRINVVSISERGIKEGRKEIKVTKPFEVKVFTPPFLIENDSFTGYIVIKNMTGEVGKVRIDVEVDGGNTTFKNGEYELKKTLRLPLRISNVRENLSITAYASFNDHKDAIRMEPVVHSKLYESFISKIIKVDGEYVVGKDMNVKIVKDIRDIIGPSIKALIHYPYGCTEQTMSSFYPAVIAKGIVEVENLDDIVMKGLQRLLRFQHYDGGWGWWPNDDSNIFMTSYVLEGFYYAMKKGYPVPKEAVEKGLDFLKKSKITGYSWFVLSLYGIDVKYETSNKSVFDMIYSSPDDIRRLAVVDDYEAYIPSGDSWFHTKVEYTAIAARTLTRSGKYLDLRDKFINYLLNIRKFKTWYSTKDTALAVLAIVKAQPKFEGELKVVEKNGEKIVTGEGFILVEGKISYVPKSKNDRVKIYTTNYKRYEVKFKDYYIDAFISDDVDYIPIKVEKFEGTITTFEDDFIPEDVRKLFKEGKILYYDEHENFLIVEAPIVFEGNEYCSFGVEYYNEQSFYKIYLRRRKAEDGIIKVGDVFKTVIDIAGEGEYMVIEENLPACAQVLRNYTEKISEFGKYWWYKVGYTWVMATEYKLDRIAYFVLDMVDGEIQYYWRVTSEGVFTKKPTHVYSMYSDAVDFYTDYKLIITHGR